MRACFAVVAGGEALAGGGDVAVVDEGDEGGVHAASVAAGEVGVRVVGIGFDLLVAESDGGVGEGLDAVADVGGDGDAALGGEEGVVGVVGGVEEVLTVELAEDERHEDVAGGDGGLRVVLLDGLEAGEGAVVVEVVEVVVGLADLGSEIDGVGVGGGVVGVREGWGREQEREEKRLRILTLRFMVLLRSSRAWLRSQRTLLMPIRMIGLDAADLILDAGRGKLYPLVPGNRRCCCTFTWTETDFMTRVELLQLLVGQARSNGFEFRRWYVSKLGLPWQNARQAVEMLAAERRYYALLFSHEFASTLLEAG